MKAWYLPQEWLRSLRWSLAVPAPEREQQLRRLRLVERDIVLPIKFVLLAFLFFGVQRSLDFTKEANADDLVREYVLKWIPVYAGISAAGAGVLFLMNRVPLRIVQWTVFTTNLADGILLAALTLVSGGYASIMYWAFVVLVLRNAASLPPATLQLIANLCVCACYLSAGLLDMAVNRFDLGQNLAPRAPIMSLDDEVSVDAVIVRVLLLLFAGATTYGMQVLLEKQRIGQEEAAAFTVREAQVQSASRVAAEVAHQIKNPLAIINNAIYSLRKLTGAGPPSVGRQLDLIAEEVERSDRIITELMGFAKLAEGKVEKLRVAEELERAIAEVFPPGAEFTTQVHRDFEPRLPIIVMQRNHLNELLVNLLLNAREALNGQGNVSIASRLRPDSTIEITIHDDGPGIAPDHVEKVFEAYYTTKPRGSGLGLSIARHNVELYGGSIQVQSALGKGATFTLTLPSVTPLQSRQK